MDGVTNSNATSGSALSSSVVGVSPTAEQQCNISESADAISSAHVTECLLSKDICSLRTTCVEINNKEKDRIINEIEVKKILGKDRFIGADIWKNRLGENVNEPQITADIKQAVKEMDNKGWEPLLVLDSGKSLTDWNKLLKEKDIHITYDDWQGYREQPFAQTTDNRSKWILIPTAEYGVFPGSTNKQLSDQLSNILDHPSYKTMKAREVATVTILAYIKNERRLFPLERNIYGRCEEKDPFNFGQVCVGNFGHDGITIAYLCNRAGPSRGLAARKEVS